VQLGSCALATEPIFLFSWCATRSTTTERGRAVRTSRTKRYLRRRGAGSDRTDGDPTRRYGRRRGRRTRVCLAPKDPRETKRSWTALLGARSSMAATPHHCTVPPRRTRPQAACTRRLPRLLPVHPWKKKSADDGASNCNYN
jgi:hypothetical protein